MQKFKSLILVALIFAMFFSFAGCNKNKDKDDDNTTTSQKTEDTTEEEDTTENTTKKPKDKLTVEDIIESAIESAASIESYDMDLNINSNMTFLGLPITSTSTTTGTGFTNPMKMMTNSVSIIRNVSKTEATSYMEKLGNMLYVYSKVNNGNWTKQELDGNAGQFNVLDMISLCLNSIENLEKSDDDVDGISVYKVDGTISGESMEKIVNKSGLLNNLSALGGSSEIDLSGIYDGLDDMSLTLWIDKDTYYPIQYDLDLTQISSRILDKMKESGTVQNGAVLNNVTIKTYNLSTTLSNFNSAEDFDIPSEAKNGEVKS